MSDKPKGKTERSLDRFFRAIEDAAHALEEFSEKQHFPMPSGESQKKADGLLKNFAETHKQKH